MANIIIPDLHPRTHQHHLDELTTSELKNVMGGTITINLPSDERSQEFTKLFNALQDPNRGPITISLGSISSPPNPYPSNPFDKSVNPF